MVGNSLDFWFSDRILHLDAGTLGALWAAIPHRVVTTRPGAKLHWLTIPLSQFLSWNLPSAATAPLLNGSLLLQTKTNLDDAVRHHRQFEFWEKILSTGGSHEKEIVSLEAAAKLRELTDAKKMSEPSAVVVREPGEIRQVEQMSGMIAANYQQTVRVADIASAAGVSPSYAMALFRRHYGATLNAYLTQIRLQHVQRELVISDSPITEILFDAGFSSVSQFYDIFKRANHCTPAEYRARHTERRTGSRISELFPTC